MPTRIPLAEEDQDYIDEVHIHSFAKALVWEEQDDILDTSPTTPVAPDLSPSTSNLDEYSDEKGPNFHDQTLTRQDIALNPVVKPDLITSKSDWYPLTNSITNASSEEPKKKYRKSNKKSALSALRDEFRSSASYTLLRWPILTLVGFWIFLLSLFYLSIRVYVALSEYYFTWTGKRKRLRDRLRGSRNYEEWIENAVALDEYLGLDKWSENPRFSYYDYKTVKLAILRLRALKKEGHDDELMVFLQGCIKKNFGGIENEQLYSHRYYGTKKLVDEYYKEVTESIDVITNSSKVSLSNKRKFFRIISKNYGKSALCLSGGACFAYTHFGIVKAMLDNGLLPTIISGTSGGGLVAALACCRTDEELKALLVPQLARKITACEDPWSVWIPRWWKTGARFDAVTWARKSCFFTRGSLTFAEAYKRTGRKLNISTVPADPHSPVILCNNITSPNCIIWSSLLASSAVPGILNPVVLMMKNPRNGEVVPFSLGSKWRDGSLRTDIPVTALNTYYNVNFPIVSQVNPHISLFFFAPKGSVGRPVSIPRRKTRNEKFAYLRGGFIAAALEHLLKLEIKKWLVMMKALDLLPRFMEQDWSNIWLQRFSGAVTIWPRNKLKDFLYILSDPTEEQMEELIIKGERCIFPKLLFIKHRTSIERAIERGRKAAKLSTDVSQTLSTGSDVNSDFEVHNVEYEEDDDDDDDDFEGEEEEYEFKRSLSIPQEDIDEVERMDSYDEDFVPEDISSGSDTASIGNSEDVDESFITSINSNITSLFKDKSKKKEKKGDNPPNHRRNTIF
ncbi:acyl transferase/acyl hydrolase/lysophospholipase [Scheffersomyces xylosifermentans]|uniref:acyl transferase/acyl hydrolase/lysophospholipase n=1 Tax=Scheffersomyces xylosifermentans TaxID=1304137 RepID=UPI00315C6891